jgi:glycogen synthase
MRSRVGWAPDGAQERATGCKLLFVTSEIADFLKVGGLGEVSASLPRALRRVSDARVLLPGYRAVLAANPDMRIIAKLPGVAEIPPCEIGEITTADGLTVYIVVAGNLFDRAGNAYLDEQANPWDDNDVRFARLAMAAVELARGVPALKWRPEVLHLNDWPGALAAGYLHWQQVRVPSILTIHNLAYQGLYGRDRLNRLAIPSEAFAMDGVEFHGKISFLKAGIYYASQITTVSAAYAEEITTPEYARRIFAGSDFLLMPSRFEPCGLSQMYAQRFGSLPIAHNTGGLGDMIEDGATGFLFDGPTAETFAQAIDRAKSVFDRKDHLDAMRRRAMTCPFGWAGSVRSYLDVYARALGLDICAAA